MGIEIGGRREAREVAPEKPVAVRKFTVKIPRPFKLDPELGTWETELRSIELEFTRVPGEAERQRAEQARPLELAAFRPGWVLVFFPVYLWPALQILPTYVDLAVKGRCPAENSPVEKTIIDNYWDIRNLAREIYDRLRVHDIATASSRIDDLSMRVDDIENTVTIEQDTLSINGTLQIHQRVLGLLKRLRDRLVAARDRMLAEQARPRPLDLASYERGVNRMWALYLAKRDYWERLSNDTCQRYIRHRQLLILAPLRVVVTGYSDKYKEEWNPQSTPFTISTIPSREPCDVRWLDRYCLFERGRVYWVVKFSVRSKKHLREESWYKYPREEWCRRFWGNINLRLVLNHPTSLSITNNSLGQWQRWYGAEIYYGDQLLWSKSLGAPGWPGVGETVEIALS